MVYKMLRKLEGVSLFRFKDFVVFLSTKGRFVFDVSKSNKLTMAPSLFTDSITSDSKNPFSSSVFGLKPTLIVIMSFSKEIVSLVVAQIRSIKVSDPYKGKGVRCEGELVTLKPGKQR